MCEQKYVLANGSTTTNFLTLELQKVEEQISHIVPKNIGKTRDDKPTTKKLQELDRETHGWN